MKTAPFYVDPELTQIAIAYRNMSLIADQVLPRVRVGTQEFRWYEYAKEERFTIPNTLVGRKSSPNEVEFGMEERTSATRDYALEDPIPGADMANAPDGHNPRSQATEAIMDLITLGREKRVADLVFDAAKYPADNKLALVTPWTDGTTDPIGDVLTALDEPLMRPNVMVLGQTSYRTMSTHPKLVKATHGNDGDSGVVSRAQLATLFELDEVLVGRGRLNTSKQGGTPSFSRVWGDALALLYRNPAASPRNGVTFGLTFQWGERVAGSWEDRNIGMRGGTRVRSGESVVEELVAPDVGYLITGISS